MNAARKLSVEKIVDHLFDTKRIVLRNYGSIDGVALLDNLSDMLSADLKVDPKLGDKNEWQFTFFKQFRKNGLPVIRAKKRSMSERSYRIDGVTCLHVHARIINDNYARVLESIPIHVFLYM